MMQVTTPAAMLLAAVAVVYVIGLALSVAQMLLTTSSRRTPYNYVATSAVAALVIGLGAPVLRPDLAVQSTVVCGTSLLSSIVCFVWLVRDKGATAMDDPVDHATRSPQA